MTEELGRLFQYELTLLSEDPNIALTDVIGQNISVRVEQSPSAGPRYFNGFVSKFALVRMLGMRNMARLMVGRSFPEPWQQQIRDRAVAVVGAVVMAKKRV